MLKRQPAFTAVMVLTLALGIGVNTAISSVVRAIVLDPLPYPEAEELIALRGSFETDPVTWVAYREFLAWRERSRAFEDVAAHRQVLNDLTIDGRPVPVVGVEASANLFSLLGAEPLIGRTFTAEEDRLGAPGVVILSYLFWQRRFAGREDVLGETLVMEGEPFEVVGVMKPGVLYPGDFRRTALWQPMGRLADEEWGWSYETHGGLSVTGRLRDGVDLETARADMDRIAAELEEEHPVTHKGRGVHLRTVLERSFGDLRPRVALLAGAVLLVLAVACVNVANLLLVRGAGRRHELAVRRALGASRRRLVRQLLGESVMTAILGAAAGLGVAYLTLQGLLSVAEINTMPAFREITIDGRILLFTAAVALLTGIAFGLAPALAGVRGADAKALHAGIRTAGNRRHGDLLGALVVAEVALALVLSIGAALTVRSFYHVLHDDPGFDPESLLTFSYGVPEDSYSETARQSAFLDTMLERLESLPGIERATTTVPIVAFWSTGFEIAGRAPGGDKLSADVFQVSPGYFETLGVRLLRGRAFLPGDRAGAPQVVVVDELFARTFWPDGDAVGQRIRVGVDPPSSFGRLVVGMVEHAFYSGVHKEAGPTFYQPRAQAEEGFGWAVLRTSVDPMTLARTVREEMEALDAELLLDEFMTMDDRLAIHRGPERLAAALLAGFAALAFVLAAVGIYSVLAFSVAARGREIGIRVALGAIGGDVLGLVLRRGLGLTAAGVALGWIALGLVLAVASSRWGPEGLASLLYAVELFDVATWLGLTLAVLAGATGACVVPAWRASRVQPRHVLRSE